MADHSTLAVAASISCNVAVCSLFLVIADALQAAWLQAADDQEAWAEGALEEEEVAYQDRLYLYGDPAYCASATTIGAYQNPAGGRMTAIQRLFNSQISSCRILVEHGFAHVRNKWLKHTFHHSLRSMSSPVAAYFMTAVLLATCLRGNQMSKRFDVEPPSLAEHFGVE